ncbi:hypothetical protein TRAPUB_746, partial [Trametes pubescens]
ISSGSREFRPGRFRVAQSSLPGTSDGRPRYLAPSRTCLHAAHRRRSLENFTKTHSAPQARPSQGHLTPPPLRPRRATGQTARGQITAPRTVASSALCHRIPQTNTRPFRSGGFRCRRPGRGLRETRAAPSKPGSAQSAVRQLCVRPGVRFTARAGECERL